MPFFSLFRRTHELAVYFPEKILARSRRQRNGRQRKKKRSGETGSQLRHFTSWLMSRRNFAGGGSFSKPFFSFGVHHCTGPADLGSAYLSSSFLACMQMGVCRKKRMFVVLCVLSASWQDYLFEGAKGREWLCQQKGFILQLGRDCGCHSLNGPNFVAVNHLRKSFYLLYRVHRRSRELFSEVHLFSDSTFHRHFDL